MTPSREAFTRVGILVDRSVTSGDWSECLRTLEREAAALGARVRTMTAGAPDVSNLTAINEILTASPPIEMLLLVTAPVRAPERMLERVLAWMKDDPRLATVSFLSNAAGYLSFPHRNSPGMPDLSGHDETSATAALRTLSPDAGPVPIPLPAGSAIAINCSVLSLLGGLDGLAGAGLREAIAQLALRASRRGFQHRLDAGTFVASLYDDVPPMEPAEEEASRRRLHEAHPSFPSLYDQQKHVGTSPAAIAMDVARSKIEGLRILIDGSCLGPMEMGTQVQTVELVRALARRADVASISLAVPHAHMPAYAADLLLDAKISVYDSHELQFTGAHMVDIVHRPFQPDRGIPWDRWRGLGKRVLVTLQDLIAYRIGAYHPGGDEWLRYRHNIAEACSRSDGVVAISSDTRASIEEECLDIARERIYTVKNGTNHLDASALEETPVPLVERGLASMPFLLVLGATYAHKNRDLAIRTWCKLREQGEHIALVMAGANVPRGSSQDDEALAREGVDDELIVVMPDVSSSVRTWLLRHASVVLYTTSAEGFGLVPFEAAAMGTPTVHVNFGPLKELMHDAPVPSRWLVDELADYALELLRHPTAKRHNIDRILRSGASLTWDETARGLVDAYRHSLARAPRI